MKKHFIFLFLIVFIFFTTTLFAAESHYSIIINAGSSGSRLHLYHYQYQKNFPLIKDILTHSTNPGLSSFESNPQLAGPSLKKLLDNAISELLLYQIDPKTVSVSILGTAGMRLLSETKQQAIYNNVRNYINQNYPFVVKDTKTISGQIEGIYAWLDINFLNENFQSGTKTVGTIDLGGASTQITFATSGNNSEDEVSLKINNKHQFVFSKSFLGLGLDQVRTVINTSPNAASCYPINYPLNEHTFGQFDFSQCGQIYADFIRKKNISQQVLPLGKEQFVAFSGIYTKYNFFNLTKTPDQKTVEQRVINICNKSWEQFQKDHPKELPSHLATYCADMVYIYQLLYSTLQLQGSQLSISNEVAQQPIDWSLGALLHEIHFERTQGDQNIMLTLNKNAA